MTNEQLDILKKAIAEKRELVVKYETQMKRDVEANVLKPDTLKKFNMATLNFRMAEEKLGVGVVEEALHYLMRGCWNMGEFLAHADYDKAHRI